MSILLSQIWPITERENYKIHFARWNGENQPLEVWVRDRHEWQCWQEYRPARDEFNRPFIFSLAHFYHEQDTWLFGGVYRVVERAVDAYAVELTEQGAEFVGRLKLRSSYRERATRVKLEGYYPTLEVHEILAEPYSGRSFPGFDSIDITFEELEALVRNARPDWRGALASVKGVYLISDVQTRKRYVGSAYGAQGVWGRWCDYAATGHGGNVELRALANDPTLEYCRRSFRFALLESRAAATQDAVILAREDYWKRILLSREELNRN